MPSIHLPFAALMLAWLSACEAELVAGSWTCAAVGVDAAIPDREEPIAPSWSTSFEADFCDYSQAGGFCYGDARATYTTVTSPVHSGLRAAAFGVTSDDVDARQTRCVRQGVLPQAAYYGAWYFLPEPTLNHGLWNLIHIRGGDLTRTHGLWDISLEPRASVEPDGLQAVVYDFLGNRTLRAATPMSIPIGAWFHLEFYLKRAADATGEVALYQDGQQLLRRSGVVTDDTAWGQWYVGNLANALEPSDSILYVDDVSIRSSR